MARLKPAWRWIVRVCTPSDAAWGAAAWGLIGCWVFIFLSFLLHDVMPDFAVGKEPENAPLDWTVVLVDATGAEARVPLSRDQVLYPQIKGQTRRFPEIDGAKMAVLPTELPGLTVPEAKAALLPLLPESSFPGGDKAGWWVKAVQLDLEAKGIVTKGPRSPVRLFRSA